VMRAPSCAVHAARKPVTRFAARQSGFEEPEPLTQRRLL